MFAVFHFDTNAKGMKLGGFSKIIIEIIVNLGENNRTNEKLFPFDTTVLFYPAYTK